MKNDPRVLLDENLCWKEHIEYTESKIAKYIRLLHNTKTCRDKNSLYCIFLACIPILTTQILHVKEHSEQILQSTETCYPNCIK